MAGDVHVLPAGEFGWAVRIDGTDGTGPTYRSQADAIASATEAARQARVDLVIHEADGTVREYIRFRGRDGAPPLA